MTPLPLIAALAACQVPVEDAPKDSGATSDTDIIAPMEPPLTTPQVPPMPVPTGDTGTDTADSSDTGTRIAPMPYPTESGGTGAGLSPPPRTPVR